MKESIGITGKLLLRLYDKDGVLKQELNVPNLIMNAGKAFIASRMVSNSVDSVMTHMALGDDSSNDTDATLTTLESELGRVSLSSSVQSANVIDYEATFGAGVATGTIVEAGIFNSNTSGTMLCRTTFPEINKSSSDTLTILWTVTIS